MDFAGDKKKILFQLQHCVHARFQAPVINHYGSSEKMKKMNVGKTILH